MKASEIRAGKLRAELTLFYRGQRYSWSELCKKIQTSVVSNKIKPSAVLIAQTNDVFLTTLSILYGFMEKKTVFPVAADVAYIDDSRAWDAALAIATSGSQASPKIALITRQNIISHCRNFVKIIPLECSSVWLNCMPLNHIASVMIIYRCWFNSAAMILHDNFNTQKVWQDIIHYDVTHISLVPRMLFKLLEFSQAQKPPASLKYVIVGGDKLSDDLYQRAISAGWPIYISYGMTEASSTIAIGRTPDKLKILDGIVAQVSDNSVLKITGDMIFSAYVDKNVPSLEAKWFITHDRVKLENNCLSIIGRNDYMIISGGQNIAPEYIESLLLDVLTLKNVSAELAIGKYQNSVYSDIADKESRQSWGDSIAVLFCGKEDELELLIKNNIKSIYQPRIFIRVNKIPRNSMGKIDRKAVQNIINKNFNKGKINGR